MFHTPGEYKCIGFRVKSKTRDKDSFKSRSRVRTCVSIGLGQVKNRASHCLRSRLGLVIRLRADLKFSLGFRQVKVR
jgi:hypothetical protein